MPGNRPIDLNGFAHPAEPAAFEGVVVSDRSATEATRAVARAVVLRSQEAESVVKRLPPQSRAAAWPRCSWPWSSWSVPNHEVPMTDVVGLADEVEPIDRVDLAEAVVDEWMAGATIEDAAATVSATAGETDLGDELSDAFATVAIATLIDVADGDGPAEVLGRVIELPDGLPPDQRRDLLLTGLVELVTAHIALPPDLG